VIPVGSSPLAWVGGVSQGAQPRQLRAPVRCSREAALLLSLSGHGATRAVDLASLPLAGRRDFGAAFCSRVAPRPAFGGQAPRRSGLSDLAERGRTEDFDATVLLGRSLHATHVYRPGIDAPTVIARDGFAGVPVERLAAAGCVEAQQSSAVGAGDLEGVGDNPVEHWRRRQR
jgi:hypothetical protein